MDNMQFKYIFLSVTTPRGDVNLLYNSEPVELFCHMNPYHEYFKKVRPSGANQVPKLDNNCRKWFRRTCFGI